MVSLESILKGLPECGHLILGAVDCGSRVCRNWNRNDGLHDPDHNDHLCPDYPEDMKQSLEIIHIPHFKNDVH